MISYEFGVCKCAKCSLTKRRTYQVLAHHEMAYHSKVEGMEWSMSHTRAGEGKGGMEEAIKGVEVSCMVASGPWFERWEQPDGERVTMFTERKSRLEQT
jgi:hypothetical protein